MMEITLVGNYKEEYIASIRDEIIEFSEKYRNPFNESSLYIENLEIILLNLML